MGLFSQKGSCPRNHVQIASISTAIISILRSSLEVEISRCMGFNSLGSFSCTFFYERALSERKFVGLDAESATAEKMKPHNARQIALSDKAKIAKPKCILVW